MPATTLSLSLSPNWSWHMAATLPFKWWNLIISTQDFLRTLTLYYKTRGWIRAFWKSLLFLKLFLNFLPSFWPEYYSPFIICSRQAGSVLPSPPLPSLLTSSPGWEHLPSLPFPFTVTWLAFKVKFKPYLLYEAFFDYSDLSFLRAPAACFLVFHRHHRHCILSWKDVTDL